MTKSTVYLETTVISYLAASPSRDVVVAAHQQLTKAWWDQRVRFELFVSQAVVDEADHPAEGFLGVSAPLEAVGRLQRGESVQGGADGAEGVGHLVVADPDNAATELIEEGINGVVAGSAGPHDLAGKL